jgi:hypothetical protein
VSVIVGAYAASPSSSGWQPAQEEEYFALLAELPGLGGLELPWTGALHPHDPDWLLSRLHPAWDLVVTDVGFTVGRLATDPAFGLASLDQDGRRAALSAAAALRVDVDRLNQAAGRRAVTAVELHSAPQAVGGSGAAFASSLAELAEWDWNGASLLVEHCDAPIDGRAPEKGYLSLGEEIAAIESSGHPVGISLNWGRSAIELRNADRVVDHVGQAADAGLLRAIVFSGAADAPSAFGSAWEDAHLPFAVTPGHETGEPTSLLTKARTIDALRAAGTLEWVGLKMGWRPLDAPAGDRVTMIADGIRLIEDAVGTIQKETVLKE